MVGAHRYHWLPIWESELSERRKKGPGKKTQRVVGSKFTPRRGVKIFLKAPQVNLFPRTHLVHDGTKLRL